MIHQITSNSIAVEVPEDSRKHGVTDSPDKGSFCIAYEIVPMDDAPSWDISENFPPGQWEILGRPLSITEDQWREVGLRHEVYAGYKDFKFKGNGAMIFDTATESGMSWIKSKSLDPLSIIILKKKSK